MQDELKKKLSDKSFNNQDLNKSGYWQKQQEKEAQNFSEGSTDQPWLLSICGGENERRH